MGWMVREATDASARKENTKGRGKGNVNGKGGRLGETKETMPVEAQEIEGIQEYSKRRRNK